MEDLSLNISELNEKVISPIEDGKRTVIKSINSAMVQTYWSIEKEIYMNEQNGSDKRNMESKY